MNLPSDKAIDPKLYLRMIWRRRGITLLCTVVVFCSALIGLEFVPSKYESTASLMIEERRALTRELENVIGGMRPSGGSGTRGDEKRMDQLVGRINSRPFLERVARLLHMDEDPVVRELAEQAYAERPDATIDEFAMRIVVSKLRKKLRFDRGGTGIYKITVSDPDPGHAQLLAQWIADLFMDVSAQATLEQLKTAHEFGAEQLKIYEEQLHRSEQALEAYRKSMIQKDLSKSVVQAANVTMAEALYRRVLDEAEVARLRILPFARNLSGTELDGERDTIRNDPRVVNQARGLSTSLREELTNRLLSADRQVGEWPPEGGYVTLRRGLFQLIERIVDTKHPTASGELRDALARYVFTTLDHEAQADAAEFLGQAISDFRQEAQSEPRGEIELARLEAQVDTNRELLRSFQAQLVASDVSQAAEMTNLGLRIELLEPPQVPLVPSSPARNKILLAALLLGPVLGVGIGLASEIMDPTLRTLHDFERVFGGPILGTTPMVMPREENQVSGWRKHWVSTAIIGVLVLTVAFFITRSNLPKDLAVGERPMQIVNPEASTNP